MKMMLLVIKCIYYSILLWSVESSGGGVVKTVMEGDEVVLPCDIDVDFEVIWFHLHTDNALSLSMLTNLLADDKSLSPTTQFDSRLSPEYNSDLKQIELRIKNVTVGDEGHYYCAKRTGNMFQFGNVTEVTLSGGLTEYSGRDGCGMVIGIELPGFIALVIAPLLSALLTAVTIFCCRCYTKASRHKKRGH